MRLLMFFLGMLFLSCNQENNPLPRPHQYPKIDFPARAYSNYVNKECPFSVDIPIYATTEKKDLIFEDVKTDPCWFDINLNPFNASIHCSYYNIDQDHTLEKLINDAYTMASKHNVKASFREEFMIENKYGSTGLIFKIGGPVATPYQFYLTDSINHFLRGSLYFNEKIKIDSVRPIIDYIAEDMDYVLNSLRWN